MIAEEQCQLISTFNSLGDRDKQNSYLSGLNLIKPIECRRPKKVQMRQDDMTSYEYKVHALCEKKSTGMKSLL